MDKAATAVETDKYRYDMRLYVQQQIAAGDPLAAGVGLHLLADSYAHAKPGDGEFYVGTIGHAWHGHTPDQLYTTTTGGSVGPAASWDKVTIYQASLARIVSDGLSARPNMGAGQLPDTARAIAAERGIAEWSKIYENGLAAANSGFPSGFVLGRFSTPPTHQNERATEIFQREANIRIRELSIAAQSGVQPLSVEEMGVEGGYVPSSTEIRALDRALYR